MIQITEIYFIFTSKYYKSVYSLSRELYEYFLCANITETNVQLIPMRSSFGREADIHLH